MMSTRKVYGQCFQVSAQSEQVGKYREIHSTKHFLYTFRSEQSKVVALREGNQ